MSIFHKSQSFQSLEAEDRGSESQLQVTENFKSNGSELMGLTTLVAQKQHVEMNSKMVYNPSAHNTVTYNLYYENNCIHLEGS